MDSILLKNIDVETRIGVTPRERSLSQKLKISVEIFTDLSPVGKTDELASGIDYDFVIEIVKTRAKKEHLTLENLAEEIAESVLAKFGPKGGVTVTVKKKPYPDMEYAAVVIHRPN